MLVAKKDYDDKLAADYYSKIEPREHGDIYKFLLQKLSKSDFKILGKSINYLIIRGSYTEFALILNVKELNAEIVRKIKYIVDDIKKTDLKISKSIFYSFLSLFLLLFFSLFLKFFLLLLQIHFLLPPVLRAWLLL